ncbi:MAG: DUF1795 domain-containing protein [bacterium]|nr:DUF1795 domain-containing protein [bacterium]
MYIKLSNMMQIPVRLLIAVLIIAGISASTNGCKCSKEKGRYYNEKEGFSIMLPEKWEQRRNIIPGAPITAFAPTDRETLLFRTSLVAAVDLADPAASLDAQIEELGKALKKQLPDFKILEKGNTLIDKNKAAFFTYEYEHTGMNPRVISYVLLKGKKRYVLTGAALAEEFPAYEEIFKKSIMSFRYE